MEEDGGGGRKGDAVAARGGGVIRRGGRAAKAGGGLQKCLDKTGEAVATRDCKAISSFCSAGPGRRGRQNRTLCGRSKGHFCNNSGPDADWFEISSTTC